jgi:class 3 adenylate cyclase
VPEHADRALAAAMAMHLRQRVLNREWESSGRPAFNLGIGLSTGQVAAALLGSAERMEYSVVGDVVNLSQRLQQLAAAGESVLSESTYRALSGSPDAELIGPSAVPGRRGLVTAYRLAAPPDR